MKTANDQKRQQARSLFFQTGKTQAEIAAEVGVCDKTLYLWTREDDWHRLRSASRLMPSMIIENFLAQVQELNDDIRSRPPGKRYPTVQEAEIIRKMMLTIDRSKKKHTQPEYMELMQKFLEWIGPKNIDILQTITDYADDFLKSQSTAGFHPYDIEYMDEPSTSRHPEFISGSYDNQDKVEASIEAEPTDPQPQVTFPTFRHPELVSGPYNNTDKAEASTEAENQSQDRHPELVSGTYDNTDKADQNTITNSKPEIIGNYEKLQQHPENQQEPPQNTPIITGQSVIINQPETSNNDYKPNISPEDLARLMTLLEKMNEINERNDKPKPDEEGQLYSIGEKVFRMKPR